MTLVAIVSFRLGGPDGVSIEAAKWADRLVALGFDVVTVAGAGPVDRLVPGLAIDAGDRHRRPRTLERALADADLVVVENLCSLPLNPAAAGRCRGRGGRRPTVLHHHDLPWQRDALRRRSPAGRPTTRPGPTSRSTTSAAPARGAGHRRPRSSPTASTPTRRRVTAPAPAPRSASAPGERAAPAPHAGHPPQERARRPRAGGGARRHLLAPRAGRGGLRARAGAPAGRCAGPHDPRLAGRAPGSVADAYAACDAVVVPVDVGGVRQPDDRVGRPPPSAGRERLPGAWRSWRPTGSGGSRSTTPPRSRPSSSGPTPRCSSTTTTLARRHFSLAALERRLAALLRREGGCRDDRAAREPVRER